MTPEQKTETLSLSDKVFPNEAESPIRAHAVALAAIFRYKTFDSETLQEIRNAATRKLDFQGAWESWYALLYGFRSHLKDEMVGSTVKTWMEMIVTSYGSNDRESTTQRSKLLRKAVWNQIAEELKSASYHQPLPEDFEFELDILE